MILIRINEFMVLYDYERSTRHLFIAKNFHNSPAPLSNTSLVAKETPVGGRQRPLSFLSFFSRRDSHLLAGGKDKTMETRK